MSTSLQRDFFAKHAEVYFLGGQRSETTHGWISDEMASIAEVGLRYTKDLMFNRSAAKKYLKKHFENFEATSGKKLLCFSSESMAFTMHYDVDVVTKAMRLHDLFGQNCKVLMVIRNQLDLFRSYYFECVRCGYPGYFGDFIEYHYFHQFRSMLSDLYYDKLFEVYAKLFGRDNIIVKPMELLAKDMVNEFKKLALSLNIDASNLDIGQQNSSSDKLYLQAVRLMNEKFPNNMGNTYYGMTDTDKLEAYWRVELGENAPPSAINNNGTRMLVYRAAQSVVKDFVGPLVAEYSEFWEERMHDFFAQSNKNLQERIGLGLSEYGYPLP
ncbi:hypothetical protein [uncultured Pseudodesulfovibrio sp.]|uniref:hypothetical protein n=1 Tax=uncultured Pseudodesulfovibrio sp. TaxID=2035858 RepID=UPI0037485A50